MSKNYRGRYNRLSSSNQYKLVRWVENNAQLVMAIPDVDVAKKAEAELDISITDCNIAGARAVLGMYKKEVPRTSKVDIESELSQLKASFSALSTRLIGLDYAVSSLLNDLGEKPANINALLHLISIGVIPGTYSEPNMSLVEKQLLELVKQKSNP